MIILPITGRKILSNHFQLTASAIAHNIPPNNMIQILDIENGILYIRAVTTKLSKLKIKTANVPEAVF